MATSRPTKDIPVKRSPNPRPIMSVPAVPTISSTQKPETNHSRRKPNSAAPLSPSATKRPTAPKNISTSTSLLKTQNPKRTPSQVITPSRDRVQGSKSHQESLGTAKSSSLSKPVVSTKPKTEIPVTKSSSSKNSTKVGGASALIRGRSPCSGIRTADKVGGTGKLTSTRGPSTGGKTGTRKDGKGSISRVSSAPDLIEKIIDIQKIKEVDVPEEEEQVINISPTSEDNDDKIELLEVTLSVEENEEIVGLIETGENESQNGTSAEIKVEEKSTIEEATSKSVIAETIPVPAVQVQDILVQTVPMLAVQVPTPVVPVQAVMVPAVPVQAKLVATVPVQTAPVPAQGKEAPTSNAAIQETRSKLIEARRSKVRALVGAFESVIREKDKEKEREGESQTPGQSAQTSPTVQSGESTSQSCESERIEDGGVEEVEKQA